jgi:hypothetical protein
MKHKLETTAVVAAALQLCLVSPLARLLLVRSRLTQLPREEVGASQSLRAVRFTSLGIENWQSKSQHRVLPYRSFVLIRSAARHQTAVLR